MTSAARKQVVQNYVDAFNRGDVNGVCECFASNALVFGVLGWGEVPEVRAIWEQLVECFSMQLKVESMACEGDVVAVRYTESGKFVAPFRGNDPTGLPYEVVAMEWFEVADEGIAKRWGARDAASIFRQMGIPLS